MNKKLIIILGPSGSGKTSFAKYYANKNNGFYMDFDLLFDYKKPDYQKFLNRLRDLLQSSQKTIFVLDGYILQNSPSIQSLKNNLQIEIKFCLCFASPEIIEQRQKRKTFNNEIQKHLSIEDIKKQIQNLFQNIILNDPDPILIDTGQNNIFKEFKKEEWVQIWQEKLFIFELSQKKYDKYYQTIELPFSGKVIKGYSDSQKTWEKLENTINFKNQTVLDIGSFHGFFSFRSEEAGAKKITGIEKSKEVVLTARHLSWLKKSKALFLNKEIETFKSKDNYDIVLVLNMLHYVKNFEKTLNNIFNLGKLIVFEIQVEQEKSILKYAKKYNFEILKKINSHRLEREILILKNKNEKNMPLKETAAYYSYSSKIYTSQKLIKSIKSVVKKIIPLSIIEIYRKKKYNHFR